MPDIGEDKNGERVCRGCVGEGFLRALIDRDGVVGECAFCGADDEPTEYLITQMIAG
jgi:hypothetical protein